MRFTVISKTKQFYFDTSTNSLYKQDGSSWSEVRDVSLIRQTSTTKNDNPHTLKISLGHGCNYDCSYCMQKDIGNPNERKRNFNTDFLIDDIKNKLNLDSLERLELWGGETLLYWNDIVPILDALDREGLVVYIPTNGTPLQHKHLDYFEKMKANVAIGISHDGPAHEKLRGKEFLHKKVDVLRRLQTMSPKVMFSFNPVISNINFNLFEINDFFAKFLKEHDLQPTYLSFELGTAYGEDGGSFDVVISGDNLSTYKDILKEYIKVHIKNIKEGDKDKWLLKNNFVHNTKGVIPYAQSLLRQNTINIMSNCGMEDPRMISVDMQGNVLGCQNTTANVFSIGSIRDIKKAKVFNIVPNERYDEGNCGSCPVYVLCKGSCPMSISERVHSVNCRMKKTHYSEILKGSLELIVNEPIESVTQQV